MNYEKKYKEALERAKTLYENANGMILKKWVEQVFPELSESEDEKIRKWLEEIIEGMPENSIDFRDFRRIDVLHWLEKQGEQKSTELPKGEDYGIDGLWNAIRILEKTLGKVEGYQTDDGILEHECAINAVKELYKQKSVLDELEMTLSVSEDAYLRSNLEKLIKELKKEK